MHKYKVSYTDNTYDLVECYDDNPSPVQTVINHGGRASEEIISVERLKERSKSFTDLTLNGVPVKVSCAVPINVGKTANMVDLAMDNLFHKHKDEKVSEPDQCFHKWKTDSYFSAMKYTTCIKCGQKKEEL